MLYLCFTLIRKLAWLFTLMGITLLRITLLRITLLRITLSDALTGILAQISYWSTGQVAVKSYLICPDYEHILLVVCNRVLRLIIFISFFHFVMLLCNWILYFCTLEKDGCHHQNIYSVYIELYLLLFPLFLLFI